MVLYQNLQCMCIKLSYEQEFTQLVVLSTILTTWPNWLIVISKIELVVYHQCCILIGWATSRLYVIAH